MTKDELALYRKAAEEGFEHDMLIELKASAVLWLLDHVRLDELTTNAVDTTTNEQLYREALERCYKLWSLDQEDCCETADKMADVIYRALQSTIEPSGDSLDEETFEVECPDCKAHFFVGQSDAIVECSCTTDKEIGNCPKRCKGDFR